MEDQINLQYVLYEYKNGKPTLKVKFYDEKKQLCEWNIVVEAGGSFLPNENWFDLIKEGHKLPRLDALSYQIQGF